MIRPGIRSFVLAIAVVASGLQAAEFDADEDWARRARAEGVVKAVGFDDIREWAAYNFDRSNCIKGYQVRLESGTAGCKSNAWDSNVKASGKGSVRFDVLPRSGQGDGGALAIPFGDYVSSQFGANQEFWVSWRQRMDTGYLKTYRREGGGITTFKQVIIAQGDMPLGSSGKVYPANACSEAQIVVVSSGNQNGVTYPLGYIECLRYLPFVVRVPRGQFAGEAQGSTVYSAQNMRRGKNDTFNCIHYPVHLDHSGCLGYMPNEWITYLVHVKLGPEGKGISSVWTREQPGYVDSTYELYMALPGRDFEPVHRQTGLVIPKGQYYIGGDPMLKSSYKPGWGPGDGHPHAKFGKLWLLSYMSFKDSQEVTEKASTWYDEIIISRCRIAAPGHHLSAPCSDAKRPPESKPVNYPGSGPLPSQQQPVESRGESSGGVGIPQPVRTDLAAITDSKSVATKASGDGARGLTGLQIAAVLQNLEPGHWFEFPRSDLASVQLDACKIPAVMQAYAKQFGKEFRCEADQAMAYSGGAYDSKRHRLLVWGGGHAGYGGNEIYAFNVPTGAWSRLTEPTPGTFEYRYDGATQTLVPQDPPWQDPAFPAAPISVHSYDHLEYLPDQDALFAVSGSMFGPGHASRITWLFEMGGKGGWRQAQFVPRTIGGLIEHNMSTAYDPASKQVLMRGYTAAASFDPQVGNWSISLKNLPTRGLGTVGEFDPKRRLFLVLGPDRKELYEIGPRGEFLAQRQLSTKGAVEIEKCYAPGLTYDPVADAMVAWCGGGDVYSLNLDSGLWVRHANRGNVVPGDPSKTRGIRGTYGRFRYMPEYNAYIMVNGTRSNVFVYRLANARERQSGR